jgi:hypothetical protein
MLKVDFPRTLADGRTFRQNCDYKVAQTLPIPSGLRLRIAQDRGKSKKHFVSGTNTNAPFP